MAIITVKTDLLTLSQPKLQKTLGTLMFSYDDSKDLKVQFGGTAFNTSSAFLVITLSLQFNEGIFDLPKFQKKTSFGFSDKQLQLQLKALNLIYIKTQKNFIAVQRINDTFIPQWQISLEQDLIFRVLSNDLCLIYLMNEGLNYVDVVYSNFGVVEIVPEKAKPVPRIPLPNQSPPVNRRTIFDPNQHNADPAIALGSDPNDPMRFSEPINCGCYVLSDISLTRCLAGCGITR